MLYLRDREHLSRRKMAKVVGISTTSTWRICKRGHAPVNPKIRKRRKGRPQKLSDRQKRLLLRTLKQLRESHGNYTILNIMSAIQLDRNFVSERTVSRFLNRNGYFHLQARKKGLLLKSDLVKRMKFARDIKSNERRSFWTDDIGFYFDAASFQFKTHPKQNATTPRGRVWRKHSEGISFGCTTKGEKVGSGGKVVHIYAAISHGMGVVLAKHYRKLSGKHFAKFVRKKFPALLQRCEMSGHQRVFLQDGDPSQNSQVAKKAFADINCTVFKIPPRSPDLNPIENIFKLLGDKLRKDAIEHNIEAESYRPFRRRIIRTLMALPMTTIDKTIASMPKRIDCIIKSKGGRLKY